MKELWRKIHWKLFRVPTKREYDEIMHKYYEEECNPWLR